MAPISDDRDRSFEKALARHFRANAQAQASSAPPMCADSEALAAYHEGGLTPEQRNLCKTHLQDCARCQAILADLQATDEIPLDVADSSQEQKKIDLPVVLKPRRSSLWRWAAPAGALAAGLLVWVAVRENKPLQIAEVRKDVSAAPTLPVAPPKPPVADSKAPNAKEEAEGRPGTQVKAGTGIGTGIQESSATDAVGGAVRQDRKVSRAESATGFAPKPNRLDRQQGPENSVNLYSNAPQKPEPGDNTDSLATELKEKKSASPPAAAPSPAGASEVTVTSESAALQSAPSAPLQQAKPSSELPLNGRNQYDLLLLAKGVTAVTITAPHSSAQWRIGAAGIIQHSTDAGATWTLQSSGVVADLLAGSATSDKVCWIVGRAGTILLTTDGGAHWSKVPPPVLDDFTSVFGVDARQATVSRAHETYQTMDGGATWKKLAPK